MMKSNDIVTLRSIAETLSVQPCASQRILAKNADMSAALMNAVLKRFAERGWIMISNVNKRKLSYAVTPEGLNELAERGKKFVARTFKIAHTYNEYEIKGHDFYLVHKDAEEKRPSQST